MRKSSAFGMGTRGCRLCGEVVRVDCPALDRPKRLERLKVMPTANNTRHVWLVRLCTWSAFVLSLAWGTSAFAAAPMCGIHAQTVAAPPIGTPTSTDAMSAVNPCANDGIPLRALGAPKREAPRELSLPELPIRALPLLPHVGPCPVGSRLSTAVAEHEVLATGFARSIDRPPRA